MQFQKFVSDRAEFFCSQNSPQNFSIKILSENEIPIFGFSGIENLPPGILEISFFSETKIDEKIVVQTAKTVFLVFEQIPENSEIIDIPPEKNLPQIFAPKKEIPQKFLLPKNLQKNEPPLEMPGNLVLKNLLKKIKNW